MSLLLRIPYFLPACRHTDQVKQVEFFNKRIEYANKNVLLLIKFKVLLFG